MLKTYCLELSTFLFYYGYDLVRSVSYIDEISERVRFWHNAILTLLASMGGMFFAISQEKVIINYFIWIFVIMSVSLLVVAIFRLERLGYTRRVFIKKLEKEK